MSDGEPIAHSRHNITSCGGPPPPLRRRKHDARAAGTADRSWAGRHAPNETITTRPPQPARNNRGWSASKAQSPTYPHNTPDGEVVLSYDVVRLRAVAMLLAFAGVAGWFGMQCAGCTTFEAFSAHASRCCPQPPNHCGESQTPPDCSRHFAGGAYTLPDAGSLRGLPAPEPALSPLPVKAVFPAVAATFPVEKQLTGASPPQLYLRNSVLLL